MRLRINHQTRYGYDTAVDYALQQIRLTPTSNSQQNVLKWEVSIDGGTVELSYLDQHKNHTLLVSMQPGADELVITANGEVETNDTSGILGKVYGVAPLWHFKQPTRRTQAGTGVLKLARLIGQSGDNINDLHELSKAILEIVPYGFGDTFVGTTAEEALAAGKGVCQDHAQIFIACARSAGLPARYVSGYLMMNDRIDQDASHAWAEVHLESLGWVGFDVSNRISPDERYVRLATGRDSREAAPISGMRLGTASESMIVSLQVQQ